jgi:hypothetical protein
MSYCSESKSLASTKVAEMAYKHLLSIKYHLKNSYFEEGKKYMYLQDMECCLDCDELIDLKIQIK